MKTIAIGGRNGCTAGDRKYAKSRTSNLLSKLVRDRHIKSGRIPIKIDPRYKGFVACKYDAIIVVDGKHCEHFKVGIASIIMIYTIKAKNRFTIAQRFTCPIVKGVLNTSEARQAAVDIALNTLLIVGAPTRNVLVGSFDKNVIDRYHNSELRVTGGKIKSVLLSRVTRCDLSAMALMCAQKSNIGLKSYPSRVGFQEVLDAIPFVCRAPKLHTWRKTKVIRQAKPQTIKKHMGVLETSYHPHIHAMTQIKLNNLARVSNLKIEVLRTEVHALVSMYGDLDRHYPLVRRDLKRIRKKYQLLRKEMRSETVKYFVEHRVVY